MYAGGECRARRCDEKMRRRGKNAPSRGGQTGPAPRSGRVPFPFAESRGNIHPTGRRSCAYRKYDQKLILDNIEEQLTHEPTTQTRNRKKLGENEFSDWELRVQIFRVFYDVCVEGDRRIVKIKAVGHKEHNRLFIGGNEVQL